MGDRANVAIQDGDGRVYFYTHWSGQELPETMRIGLAKAKDADRLDDPSYLARILFDTLTGLRGDTTGFGISACVQDNQGSRPLLIIDVNKQVVTAGAEGLCKLKGEPAVFGFDDYIALKEATWDLLDPARAE
jgi:hypothetical protein